jgi:ketosteroid isomerase-like protein
VTSSHAVDAGPAEFVERFQDAWRKSSADALREVLTDDVVLRQPSMPDVVGKTAAHEAFTRLFRAIPDLTATVHRWSARGDVVFIEFTLTGEFGGRPLSWPAVDRFIVRDGLGAERVSYFDGGKLLVELLRRPRGWRRLAASGLRPKLS